MRTDDGGTLEITPVGTMADIHVKDATGRSVATVTRSAGEAVALYLTAKRATERSATSSA
ncbi:hypothetical protein [Streptomyces sp. NPDC001404]|uniref:hypothetical protein n=1 Tax=Streptomyces sp. NPDC001404 TaxID=3364571 RepID=UPI00367AB1CA